MREVVRLLSANLLQRVPSSPKMKYEIFRFHWAFLVLVGAGDGLEPNGIQEVARSIRVSSTNKINLLDTSRFLDLW